VNPVGHVGEYLLESCLYKHIFEPTAILTRNSAWCDKMAFSFFAVKEQRNMTLEVSLTPI